jgi:hypothetical protein
VGESLACLLCHAPASTQQPWRPAAPAPASDSTRSPPERWTAALSSGLTVEPNPAFEAEAQHQGVGCIGCHWRAGAVVASTSHEVSAAARAAHPVRQEALLTQPTFCAACHQFGAGAAVNGKPLENTLVELQQSVFGRSGATCQGCHLPDGQHRFQGIHTPDLVRASVEVRLELEPGAARGALVLSNEAVGHAFPTYVTPRVLLRVQPLDAAGRPLGAPLERRLGRSVEFEAGAWREEEDSRVLPGQSARLAFDLASSQAARVRATVIVEPDAAYVPLYRGLLAQGGLPPERTAQLRAALARAEGSAYSIFEEERELPHRGAPSPAGGSGSR